MDSRLIVSIVIAFALGAPLVATACGTPTPAPAGSATASLAPSAPAAAAEADLQVKEGVHAILVGLQSWAVAQDRVHYPRRADEATLAEAMSVGGDEWPVNPFTGAGMTQGDQPGDYLYKVAKDKRSCTVTAYLSDGTEYMPQVLRID